MVWTTSRDPHGHIDLFCEVEYFVVVRSTWIAAGMIASLATARAQPAEPTSTPAPAAPPTHHVNLRVGLASSDAVNRPTVCLEVVALWSTSVEGCGTGSGILHDEVGRQMAHFRLNLPARRDRFAGGWSAVRAGLGFAELEVGPDRPGFDFGDPDQPNSVAGPDAAISVQWIRSLGGGIELVATGTLGVAWFAGADRLIRPQAEAQPYVAFEIGAGW